MKELQEKRINYKEILAKRIEDMNENTKKTVSKTPAFKKIEKKFEENVVMPELERKKKILSSLRDLHSHIDFKEIEQE